MRRFSEAYLRRTREGMWEDSREALSSLDLVGRRRVLDVGCGTGELTGVLAAEATPVDSEEPTATVVGVDADRSLLAVAQRETGLPYVAGDARRLPFADDAFDLVVCQALLINLPRPQTALEEFVRVSSDLVAAIEPNNAHVGVRSTVESETDLEQTAREAFRRGVRTDVALGDRIDDLFERVGLSERSTSRYYHTKRIAPPYTDHALEDAALKASGEGLSRHEREIRRGLDRGADTTTYDALRTEWRSMGRDVIDQMQTDSYRRVEVVPFDVTVGRV
ncbi:MAG: class I SAM-dependent methyltransferase [Halobacteriota archaeon]